MTGVRIADIETDDIAFVPEQIELERQAKVDEPAGRRQRRSETMRPIMWRLHFLGGFLAGPMVLALCISGILYAWNPQIDDLRFGDIMHASSEIVSVPLADQVDAAIAANPDWGVYSVTPGNGGDNTLIVMDPPGGEFGFSGPADAQNVYVDQATGEVTGAIEGENTSDSWLRTLHSSLRLGPNAEPLSELAGSWFFVTLLTGVYLWWPGLRRRGSMAFAARRNIEGRRKQKDWHNFLGIGLIVPMAFLALTGLTWTEYGGDRFDMVKEQLSVPRAGVDRALPAESPGQAELANIDTVYASAVATNMVEPIRIVLPSDDATGWNVASRDQTFPVERDQLTIDGSTGEVTSSFEYSDEHWFNKLRTAAVLFHQAQLFGVALQIFMTLLTLAIAALVILGYQMWWGRRPSDGLGTPPPIRQWLRSAPLPLLVAAVVLGYLMPVLGLSLLVWLAAEAGWRWYRVLNDPHPPTAMAAGPGQLFGAAALLIGGIVMIATPSFGSGIEEPSTLVRLGLWAWGWPLGILLAVVGALGVAAAFAARRDVETPVMPASDDADEHVRN